MFISRISHFIALACIFSLIGSPALAASRAMQMEVGIQKRLQLMKQIERVAVGSPEIADVTVISDREILITPKSTGTTSLTAWTRDDVEQWDLIVGNSDKAAKSALQQSGQTGFSADAAGAQIQLQGDSESLQEQHRVQSILGFDETSGVDNTRFTPDSQVQIDIKIVEISKSRLQSSGFFLGKGLGGRTPRAISSPGGVTGININGGGINLSGNAITDSRAFNLLYGRQSNGLLAALSVLEGNGFAYTLAEPSLIAMSGQSANFLAGGEFPVPIRGGVDNSVTIEYKEFGVRLALTPTVLDSNFIALKVAPEVSELDFNAGIQSGGVTVPALRVRRTDTSVTLGDGESFVISGLISQTTMANVDKLPGLGDIPILGAFFRSNQLDREDRELLMIVTPHVVKPFSADARLPELPGENYRNYAPDYTEFLFLEDGDFNSRHRANHSGFSK